MKTIALKYTLAVAFLSITYLLGILVLPKIIKYFKTSAFLDNPNWRSAHTVPTPSSGGVSFGFTLLVMIPFLNENGQLLGTVLAAFLLGGLGFADDRLELKPKLKFLIQILSGTILYTAGLEFKWLNGLFGFYEINSIFSYGLTILFIVGIVNAFNLIDGVDGLAAGLAVIASGVFGVLFIFNGDFLFAMLAFSLIGSLLAFLKFNFSPAKIFMGDTGSLIIGALMGAFFIRIFNTGNSVHSTIALTALLFPVIDMTRLFVVRIINKKSPFSADKNHYHHLLIKSGDSHKKVAISGYLILTFQLITGLIVGLFFEITIAFVLAILLSFTMYIFISLKFFHVSRRKSNEIIERINESKNNNYLIAHYNEK